MKPLEQLLAETKAVVEAATPGPWELSKHNPTEILQIYDAESGEWVCEPVDEETGAFIAHARTMLPALIEALELAIEQRNRFACNYNFEPFDDAIAPFDQAIADIIRKAGDR